MKELNKKSILEINGGSVNPIKLHPKHYVITTLMLEAYNGNLQEVKSLVEYGVDINFKTVLGETALSFARDKEVAKYLISVGADYNNIRWSGYSGAKPSWWDGLIEGMRSRV